MLAYKLDGIPDEYDGYYYRISEEENGFADSLKRVMELSGEERCDMGEKAKKFVSENKNPTAQCLRIVELINSED